jgi:hypothetical protein
MTLSELVAYVEGHRAYTHPIFDHWGASRPQPDVIGAMFHHIGSLCACSRPAWSFETALAELDRPEECQILKSIVNSEEDHGPQLAVMAGHIVNCAAREAVIPDLNQQVDVERRLRAFSARFFDALPSYSRETGMLAQDRRVKAVFDRRKLSSRDATLGNVGALLAIEMLANGHIIPGEVRCLVDSELYGASMATPEMEYLREHAGDEGAECWHEEEAKRAVGAMLDCETEALIFGGLRECLDAVCGLWDLLDSTLLASQRS